MNLYYEFTVLSSYNFMFLYSTAKKLYKNMKLFPHRSYSVVHSLFTS